MSRNVFTQLCIAGNRKEPLKIYGGELIDRAAAFRGKKGIRRRRRFSM